MRYRYSLILGWPHSVLIRAAFCTLSVLLSGCATDYRAGQRADIARWEREAAKTGHPEVRFRQVLDPDLARALGFLPFGVAGFYVGSTGLAISGFTWPISLIWVPTKAYSIAQQRNYIELKDEIMALRQESAPPAAISPTDLHRIPTDSKLAAKQLQRLEKLWRSGRISETEYLDQRQKLIDSMTEESWQQERAHPGMLGR
jgi:hypothetical protein